MVQIAVLGTGYLGSGFAIKALENGHAVHVWNRTAAKCEPLVELGAVQGIDPAHTVVDCQRVHLVLRSDEAVDQVIAELAPGLAEGAWIIDHSTNQPDRVAERCIRLRKEGLQYIHAPVFMGPRHSRSGTGEMLISGPTNAIESLRSDLEEMTGTLTVVGPRDQDAAVHKILGNGLIIGLTALAGDLLKSGRSAGFDDAKVIESLKSFSPLAAHLGSRASRHSQMETSFALEMARKDIELLLAASESKQLSILPGCADSMDALIALGHAHDHYTVIAT